MRAKRVRQGSVHMAYCLQTTEYFVQVCVVPTRLNTPEERRSVVFRGLLRRYFFIDIPGAAYMYVCCRVGDAASCKCMAVHTLHFVCDIFFCVARRDGGLFFGDGPMARGATRKKFLFSFLMSIITPESRGYILRGVLGVTQLLVALLHAGSFKPQAASATTMLGVIQSFNNTSLSPHGIYYNAANLMLHPKYASS